jgi:hypothetical protein
MEERIMASAAETLGNEAAVKAARDIAEAWFNTEGWEAHLAVDEVRTAATDALRELPPWVARPDSDLERAGAFSRYVLAALEDPTVPEVKDWVGKAVADAQELKAQAIDPVTLGIGGAILIVAILAARVRRIGSAVEFFEGIPEELVDILKTVRPA